MFTFSINNIQVHSKSMLVDHYLKSIELVDRIIQILCIRNTGIVIINYPLKFMILILNNPDLF